MDNFLGDTIEVVSLWEGILRRPSMYLGKPSLYGLQCFATGMLCARSQHIDFLNDFETFVRENYGGSTSFDLALEKAGNDDKKAFEVWAGWYREYNEQTT